MAERRNCACAAAGVNKVGDQVLCEASNIKSVVIRRAESGHKNEGINIGYNTPLPTQCRAIAGSRIAAVLKGKYNENEELFHHGRAREADLCVQRRTEYNYSVRKELL